MSAPPGQERGRAGGDPARPAGRRGRAAGRRGADPGRPRGRRKLIRGRGADGRDGAGDDPRGVRGGGRPGAAGHHGRVRVVRRGGHDPGSGPLPADLPIVIDLWPRDEQRLLGRHDPDVRGRRGDREVAALRDVVIESLEAARAAARPGVTGGALYDAAAEVVERAGYPTQRTRKPGERLTHGFYFALGHGVGLEVHEPPRLGFGSAEPLVAGDVLAIEPGVEGWSGSAASATRICC